MRNAGITVRPRLKKTLFAFRTFSSQFVHSDAGKVYDKYDGIGAASEIKGAPAN